MHWTGLVVRKEYGINREWLKLEIEEETDPIYLIIYRC